LAVAESELEEATASASAESATGETESSKINTTDAVDDAVGLGLLTKFGLVVAVIAIMFFALRQKNRTGGSSEKVLP